MRFDILFSFLSIALELGGVFMQNAKGPLTLILGPLTGLLVMSGYIDGKNADDFVQQTQLIIGAIITIVTAIGALHHDIEIRKIEAAKPVQPAVVPGSENIQ